jgi:transcriptional regulator with XRE-family HTH domain
MALVLNGPVNVASGRLARSSTRTHIGRLGRDLRRQIGAEIRRLRLDCNLSQRALATAADIDQGYLSQIEAGIREPSLAVLLAIGDVLGADLVVRLYPTTGPRVHDRTQAPMIDALIGVLHHRWKPLVEVPVRRPSRGFIDLVIADPAAGIVVAVEVQSQIRRVEQQLRWSADKSESLPSASAWPTFQPANGGPAAVSQLLVLRSTRATRHVARSYESLLGAAYPARMTDVRRSLIDGGPWPGSGVLWVAVEGGRARILDFPPRGVSLGR